jgi:1-aminocyclopropane-1-carboxylate deaminase/D-cysteine desulfhydrase-like pyridoxal-dependent ACC family enzyme
MMLSFVETMPEKLIASWLPPYWQVSVLRLDKLHPLYGGNKILKLQGWIETAKQNHKSGFLSVGGPWSNHLHATAAYCAEMGLPMAAGVGAAEGFMTPTLQDIKNWGFELFYAGHSSRLLEVDWPAIANRRGLQYIPMGGEGPLGEGGVTAFFNRLAPTTYDEVWCPVGTGTTLAGMAASSMRSATILAVNPGLAVKEAHRIIENLKTRFPNRRFYLEKTDYQGFGKISAEVLHFMGRCYATSGVVTDVVYTGKMMYALACRAQMARKAEIKSILIIHTGGLQGNRSVKNGVLPWLA